MNGSVEICKKLSFLAFQRLDLGRTDNSRMFIFLTAFEDGTSPNISFCDPIYIHLHSLFQKQQQTRNSAVSKVAVVTLAVSFGVLFYLNSHFKDREGVKEQWNSSISDSARKNDAMPLVLLVAVPSQKIYKDDKIIKY
ncbi:hypothetical protein EK904_003036 [Melospiza melodia maxima]|nr:hypothetical protein EK904_003036 [Melospiza melodia maxima]